FLGGCGDAEFPESGSVIPFHGHLDGEVAAGEGFGELVDGSVTFALAAIDGPATLEIGIDGFVGGGNTRGEALAGAGDLQFFLAGFDFEIGEREISGRSFV